MIFRNILIFISLLLVPLNAKELKQVSLQLQWKYQFQFAGYILAKEKGFYEDIGLDVSIDEWEHGINMVDMVASNASQYAVSRPTSLIDISKGKEIIYLATIFQSSPLVLLSDASTGIKTVKDFKDKRIMTTGDLNTDTSLLSMMYSQGISLDDLNVQKPTFNVKDLLDKKTDLIASYISNEPFTLKELGGTPVIFKPKDYGFDFYNDIVITSKKYLENNPSEVKKFREATLKGWEYAFANIEESVEIILEKYNTQKKTKKALEYEAKELKKLAFYKTNEIGTIEVQKLEKIYDVYKLLGLVNKELDFDQIIYSENSLDTSLNKKEKEYLQNKKSIKMCIDPNWMPFESFDKHGNYIGMSADYYKVFEKTLDITFDVLKTSSWKQSIEYAKERKCDIFSLAMETPQRKKYMNFTTPYLTIPLVVTTKVDVHFVNEIQDLIGKKIGITRGYAFAEILKSKYPSLDLVSVEDIDDGLDQVNSGKLFGYIGTLASIGYKFQTKYSGQLKISGKITDNWELGIGVRNDDKVLLGILQKAINNITQDEKRAILNKWISIKYEKGIDYALLYQTIIIFTFILLVVLYFYFKQKQLKKKLEYAYKELEKIAIRDKLTGIYNRHKLDEILEIEKIQSDRHGYKFGVMLIDIDHFKKVNDTYGHHIGDEILVEFSRILLKNSRKSDYVGRWGGEEFLIIIPNTNDKDMKHFADTLKSKIETNTFKNIGHMTASIGVATYENNEEIKSIIHKADNALYTSKNNGRNQVTFK